LRLFHDLSSSRKQKINRLRIGLYQKRLEH
jgi:hypothetical protein